MSITASQLATALRAAANALDGVAQANSAGGIAAQPTNGGLASQVANAVSQPTPVLAAAPVQPAPASNVTEQMVTDLIQPHVANEAIRAALGAAMRGLGVNSLPEAQAHQYGTLYEAFKNVLAQHGVGGQGPAPAPTSII
jgi:hypothetical protein